MPPRPNRERAMAILNPARSLRSYVVPAVIDTGAVAAFRTWLAGGPSARPVTIALRSVHGDLGEAELIAAALRRHRGLVRVTARGQNGPGAAAILAAGQQRAAAPEATFAPPTGHPHARLTAPVLRALAVRVADDARAGAERLLRANPIPSGYLAAAATGRTLTTSDLLDTGLLNEVLFS